MDNKKPFEKTFVGKLLQDAKGLLPEKGILGVLKGLIDSDDTLTPEEKKDAREKLLEAYKVEVSDRDSARKREASVRKYGFDFLFNLSGVVGLGVFVFLAYVITTREVPENNKEIFIHLIGIVEGVALSIFGYFFGAAIKKNK